MSVGNGGLYVKKNKQKNGLDLNMNFYELFEIFNGGSVPSEKPAPVVWRITFIKEKGYFPF